MRDAVTVAHPAGTTQSLTATVARVALNTAAVQLAAANPSRMGLSIFNDGSTTLLVLLGSGTPSTTAYTVQLVSGAYYELPALAGGVPFAGLIQGIWTAAGTGGAQVTELT